MGVGADEFVGVASDVMEMDKGGLWFNITAPMYSVQIYNVVTTGGMVSTVSGGTTVSIPVTWTTGAATSTSTSTSGITGSTTVAGRTLTKTAFGTSLSLRVPTFESISEGMTTWSQDGLIRVFAVGMAVILGIIAVL